MATTANPAPAATLPGSNPEQVLYSDLVSVLGLSPQAAAGVLGNAQVESGFNTASYNPNEGAVGLFQWEGGRRTALDAYAVSIGQAETSLAAQIGYLNKELTGPYESVLAELRATRDPAAAARIFDVGPGGTNSGTGFENSSGAADLTRQSFAQQIYAQIQSAGAGSLTGGAGAAFAGIKVPISPLPGVIPGPSVTIPGTGGINIPGLGSSPLSGIAGDIENAILDGVKRLAAPLVKFLTNAFVVIVGVILIILAIRLLADSDTASAGEFPGGANPRESGPALGTGHDQHEPEPRDDDDDDDGSARAAPRGQQTTGGGGGLGAKGMGAQARRGARDVEAAAA